MIRTQIYLTEGERAELGILSAATGKGQSELIRDAVDDLLGRFSADRRTAVLDNVAGIWKDRDDLPDFVAVRKQWDRGGRT
jgi:hypothetical protein